MSDFLSYAAIDAVNHSTLKHMRKSPLAYRHAMSLKLPDKTFLRFGRAVHSSILEPTRFEREYGIFDGKTRRGAAWEAICEQYGKENVLTRKEHQLCRAIRHAVLSNPVAASYFEGGAAEVTITWTDEPTRLRCKGRLDFVSESRPAIIDLKSARDLTENRFATAAARLAYHVQAAWYRDGFRQARGVELPFVLVGVEVEPPHEVGVFRLDDDALYAGEREYRRLLDLVRKCTDAGHWPGMYSDERTLVLPSWVTGDDEEDVGGLKLEFGDEEAAAE